MELQLDNEDIRLVKELLEKKQVTISAQEIREHIQQLQDCQQSFPILSQKAMLVQLLHIYHSTGKKEVLLLDELELGDGKQHVPIRIILGVLAEDWPGMSNSILGIVHHRKRNVQYVRGITLEDGKKAIGIVILSFRLDTKDDYKEFRREKKRLLDNIKSASQGSTSKFLLLDDEAVKYEIYNEIIKKIYKIYHNPNLVQIIEESGEAHKFVSSRSREYLEERDLGDLARLIVDNYSYQNLVLSGYTDKIIKIKNFQTETEKLTGITFICKEMLFSVEDFLRMLDFIVPDHILKHHKSFVTREGIMVYRVEIADRYGKPLSTDLSKSLENSMERLVAISCDNEFSKLKSVGGSEHYARAIIPFLREEVKKTGLSQVFFNVERKTDFVIFIKLIVVSRLKTKKKRIYDLIFKLSRVHGIDIISTVPPKIYGESGVDIVKLKVNLVDFRSVKAIYVKLKEIIGKIYGDIRDFDEGFREMYISRLNQLLENLPKVNPVLVRDIFFSIDELYRFEIPQELLMEVITLCAQAVDEAKSENCDKLIVKHKTLPTQNGTLIVVSYEEYRKLLSKVVNHLRDTALYFIKIEWNQRFFLLMFLKQEDKPLEENFITKITKEIKELV